MKKIGNTWRKHVVSSAIIFVFSILSLFSFAESYRYDFDVLEEDDWELWGNESIWQVKDGVLRASIHTQGVGFGLLQFKGISGNYETFNFFADNRVIQRQVKKPGHEYFTIIVKTFGAERANFGIALGRRFPNFPGDEPYFYLFTTRGIEAKTYKWHTANRIRNREQRHPDTIWNTGELASMEIRFNRGHFQWFADDEKRANFEDPDFSRIEIIGFIIQSNGVHIGSAWVDSFSISGAGLAVSPQAKVTTTWGELKRF